MKKFNEKIKLNPKAITDKVDFLKDKAKFDVFKDVVSYMPKFLMLPVRSAITIALIPPTLKYLFPEESEKLHPKKQDKNNKILGVPAPRLLQGGIAR